MADHSSIPYLVLALRDPDTTVAYGAYTLLHRLIALPATPKDKAYYEAYYEAHREAANEPLYAWWHDELLGKHLPAPKPPERPVAPPATPSGKSSGATGTGGFLLAGAAALAALLWLRRHHHESRKASRVGVRAA